MSFKHLSLAAVAATMISAAGIALAQPMEGGWHHGGGAEFLHGLNLTDAQKAEVHKIEHAAWTQSKPVMQQMHTLHEQIITKLLTAGTTAEQVQPLVQQEEQLRTQIDSTRLATALQLRTVLTPQQLAQAAATHEKLAALHAQELSVLGAGHEGDN